ncbi:tRNA pseudouridine(38-40) synthase TruA [Sphingorhabdus sp.]|jgi:tRNA pseudouridine38-40 synthase|uniref:tRNA pseudouridine(38-40) synthase TruA n=1 Tax=Sphingorhabdus sp. TaxID=1902408 RepID=UPI00273FC6A8|nr:tRNA pseudouridine(38-40) synthase TruA [Sphingorhabdus sp.]MCF8493139.1 tRNA pseudouridine(38-40) synthase TruA [Sphingomonadaceae bacterium]MCF8497925.1 tRNA pseudouridine(38-40) synthase TruA [Sphingomonadaceae bacterium]MDP4872953.1 tRNA pseudouridine(38-40) synthase TruA [Sphingorhabdus sp.]MDP4927965.1 tRNA pseudouridine(38-40) synthase TruA [Sphingorhabdus sp.]
MTRFALTIEFDGGPYMGWQWQDHGPSVQGTIEEAIFKTTGEKTLVYSAGRTDAGVHALGMRAHVDVEKGLSAFRLMEAINAHLRPHPIAILACEEVADDWHARYSCIGRAYAYRILNRRASLTLERGRVWRVGSELDADAMNDAAQILVGLHDFTTFRSTACQAASPVKTLDRLNVRREGQHVIIEAAALSFLHHQVRSMVGCLVAVGLGRWNAADLKAALDAADRSALAENAPPEGLYFVRATYP